MARLLGLWLELLYVGPVARGPMARTTICWALYKVGGAASSSSADGGQRGDAQERPYKAPKGLIRPKALRNYNAYEAL